MPSTGVFEGVQAVDRMMRAQGYTDGALTLALINWIDHGVDEFIHEAAVFFQKRYDLFRRKGRYWDEKRLADAKQAFIDGVRALSANPDSKSRFHGYDRRYMALVNQFKHTQEAIYREARERTRAELAKRSAPPPWLGPRAQARRAEFRRRREHAWTRWFVAVRDAVARGFEPPPAPGEHRRSGPPIRRLCRSSINPMPDIKDIVEAYHAARGRGRVAEKIRCGSLLLDAEAGVDSSLIRTEAGEIVGRKPGLRGWIGDRAPWLLKHYVSLMQYRRLAQAFREAHGLRDPHPATLLLDDAAPRIFPQPLRGRLEAARREAKALLESAAGRTVEDFRQALARREWRRTG